MVVYSRDTGMGQPAGTEVEPTVQTTVSPLAHPAGGNGEALEYRTLSVLAIVSLVLGLASPLCLLAPLLLAIAYFGAATSIVALRRIASSGGLLAGRGVALAALALSVASLGAFYGRDLATRQLLTHQAKTVALQWFELLQTGQAEQALELTVRRAPAAPQAEPGEAADKSDTESIALANFRENPLVRNLSTVGKRAAVRWSRNLSLEAEPHGLGTVEQLYSVTSVDPKQAAFEARLTLQRARKTGRDRPTWLITDYGLAGASPVSPQGG